MKKFILLINTILFIIFVVNGEYALDKTCKEAVSDLTKKQLKKVSECTGLMKFKNGKEKNEKKTCVMKCVLMGEGTLDPDGYPDPIGTMVFVEKSFPFAIHPWVRTVIMGCFGTTGGIDPKEANCKSYDPMIKCAMNGLSLFCNEPTS